MGLFDDGAMPTPGNVMDTKPYDGAAIANDLVITYTTDQPGGAGLVTTESGLLNDGGLGPGSVNMASGIQTLQGAVSGGVDAMTRVNSDPYSGADQYQIQMMGDVASPVPTLGGGALLFLLALWFVSRAKR